jgi:hypothetical protein
MAGLANSKTHYSPRDFGLALYPKVSQSTVTRWVNAGKLNAINASLCDKPNFRIPASELARVQGLFDENKLGELS